MIKGNALAEKRYPDPAKDVPRSRTYSVGQL